MQSRCHGCPSWRSPKLLLIAPATATPGRILYMSEEEIHHLATSLVVSSGPQNAWRGRWRRGQDTSRLLFFTSSTARGGGGGGVNLLLFPLLSVTSLLMSVTLLYSKEAHTSSSSFGILPPDVGETKGIRTDRQAGRIVSATPTTA